VQHVQIYQPCNFEVNPITHFGVISLFSSNFQNFNTHWRPLLQTNLGRVSPFNASYQNCCKKTYVNDSQNLAFATSHIAKMFSMSRSTRNFSQLKICDNCVKSYSSWNAFFVDSLLLVTQIIKGKQLYYKIFKFSLYL
jgi:hypothetical protein